MPIHTSITLARKLGERVIVRDRDTGEVICTLTVAQIQKGKVRLKCSGLPKTKFWREEADPGGTAA